MPKSAATPIKVEVQLLGGHCHHLYLQADDPLLQRLFQAILGQSQGLNKPEIFQLPLPGGRSALCFSSQQLVGFVTEPAIYMQTPSVSSPTPEIIPSPYVQLDHFLSTEQQQALLHIAIAQASAFVPTQTTTDAIDYRQSLILPNLNGLANPVLARITEVLPNVLQQLEIPLFTASEIESQLTAHNDGNFYKMHNDNGSPETATRELTYVYYFYRQPQPFTGGELLVYDSKIENNFYVAADSFHTVEPRNNSIVFFLSRYMHEVLPVHCPSQAFPDSRFTINGWIRR